MLTTFRRAMGIHRAILPAESTRWLYLAMVGSLLVAALDMVGVAATMPLMLLATGAPPGQLTSAVLEPFGVTSLGGSLIALAALVGCIFILKSVLTIAFRYWVVGKSERLNALASARLLEQYALSSYAVHRTRDAADMHRQINTSVMQVFTGVIAASITLVVDILTLLLTLVVLLIVSPWGTLAAVVVFGGAVVGTQMLVRREQRRAGEVISEHAKDSWSALIPIVDGFREVRLSRAEQNYVEGFRRAKLKQSAAQRNLLVLTELPRYVLEVALIAGIGMIAGILTVTSSGGTIIAILGVFTAAAARMLPTLQRLGTSLGSIRSSEVGIDQLEGLLPTFRHADLVSVPDEAPADELVGDIELRGVGFHYPDTEEFSVKDVSTTIAYGSSVAFVGASGAGKSTLLDILLGLFDPTEGEVLANGHRIHASPGAWMQSVGVVSQDVYLVNDTVRANIAFGQSPDSVDDAKILDAVHRAQLGSLLDDLPDGLDTRLGERGVRISGGQRQRIGIARALYRDPAFLVLDEATSALDNITEKRITETIEALSGELTIILVAHRLSTIRNVDSVVFMDNGRLVAEGPFEHVAEVNDHFAELVRLGKLV
ncbi:ABC transporter ATP-binding protein [Helcobacillus massiliensis]|uniref:ABC-type multidrug transport system fused ATPase/permease subunit n=1 Tax=Helcobacillus massiliensis TaxID=521392 RepID=A0A839R2W4_9MICO|nr:ABC transporter ATP-binding protein [Helcobacillus massiliensis]MBB3023526.1 ABC-type multidrug transport system fused ATPase/permease subunit [Helcobacillus massiliensis]